VSTQLKISGELTSDPATCNFHLDRDIAGGWTLLFESPEEGQGSPLIDRLFAVEGIARVMITGRTIALTKNVPAPWPHLAADIAQAIRNGFPDDQPPIAPAVLETLQNAPMDGVEEDIAEMLEDHINPALASHGGFVRLIKVEGHDVFVEMGGGCQGCASSKATMRFGVESAIRRIAPQVRNIIDATDHAAGVNPYYK
jgi:Fe-S cluster biogenesis protein NfuA